MSKVFIDVNIPMYAAGKDHIYKTSCQKIIKLIAQDRIDAFTGAEIFQEILYRFSSIKQLKLGLKMYKNFFKLMSGRILPLREEDILLAEKLAKHYSTIKPRDLFHTAVMLSNNIKTIYTADKDFNQIKEIKRIDPLDAVEKITGE